MIDIDTHNDNSGTTHRSDSGEIQVGIEDVFFSLTDGRGVIKASNEVFRRLSGHSWDDLIGSSHKKIRHPDMPAGVFHLIWDRLKAGEPVGAYIKNSSKTGGHFWIMSYFMPLGDGFLSVSCKATSPIFVRIRDIYARLRDAELKQGLSPEASMKALHLELRKLGYRDFASFVADALNAEIMGRSDALGHRASLNLPILAEIREACSEIDALGGEMLHSYKAITVAPTNLQVRASRLGDLGQALASISANFTTLTTEMTAKMNAFSELSQKVLNAVDESRIGMLSKRLIAEAVRDFDAEQVETVGEGESASHRLLRSELAKYGGQPRGSSDVIKQTLHQFDKIVQEVRQLLSGLSVMRTMSQMEAARLVDEDPSIEMIVNDLRAFHDEALSRLDLIFARIQFSEKQLQKLFDIARMIEDGTLTARNEFSFEGAQQDLVA